MDPATAAALETAMAAVRALADALADDGRKFAAAKVANIRWDLDSLVREIPFHSSKGNQ